MPNSLTDVTLRDEPTNLLDPASVARDTFAQKVLNRLRERDDVTATRMAHGWLSPIEIARVAGEIHAEELEAKRREIPFSKAQRVRPGLPATVTESIPDDPYADLPGSGELG